MISTVYFIWRDYPWTSKPQGQAEFKKRLANGQQNSPQEQQRNAPVEPQGGSRKRSIKIALIVVLLGGFALVYYGPVMLKTIGFVGFLTASESHEDRYGDIDRALQEIEYRSAGTVLEESYDRSNNPTDPASFESTIQSDSQKFQILKSKIEAIAQNGCNITTEAIACSLERPAMIASIDDRQIVTLTVRD